MFQPFCCVGLWYIRGIQKMRSLCDKGQSTGVPREDIFLEVDFVQLRQSNACELNRCCKVIQERVKEAVNLFMSSASYGFHD